MKKGLLLLLLIPTIAFSQGKLDTAKEDLSSTSSSSSSGTSSSSSARSRGGNVASIGLFGELFIELFLLLGEHTVIGEFQQRSFTPHPYFYDDVKGEYLYGQEDGDKKSLVKLNANYLFSDNVNATDLSVNYRFNTLFGIEASHQYFSEKLVDRTSHLNISSLMVNYYRLREKNISGWWGVGLTHVGNSVDEVGFGYNLGLEMYFFKPISFHTSFKQSFINESSVSFLKIQAKYHRKKTAFYTGYHDISLGSVKTSGFVLGVEYTF